MLHILLIAQSQPGFGPDTKKRTVSSVQIQDLRFAIVWPSRNSSRFLRSATIRAGSGATEASAALGPGCVKTKSDLVVMPSERRIFALFCPERDHKPQNSGCGYTRQSFHTAWVQSGRRAAEGQQSSPTSWNTFFRRRRSSRFKGR
jgi:hypothetical protein